MKLHQFPISHYCEKVRWTLDYKGLKYQPVNYLPGRHLKPVKQLSGQTAVPVLTSAGQVISGSADIITFLDQSCPDRPLTPADTELRQQALDWEARLDNEAGPAVRLWVYHHLLSRPDLLVPMLAAGQPFWVGWLLRMKYAEVEKGMRRWMNVNDEPAAAAQKTMETLLEELRVEYSASHFLVGESFSRADLAACSLFAMTFQPQAYGIRWPKPDQLPAGMQQWLCDHEDLIEPLRQRYAQYR